MRGNSTEMEPSKMPETTTVSIQNNFQLFKDELVYLKDELNLGHWRIEFSTTPASAGTHFEVVTNRPRNHASIRVNPEGIPKTKLEQLLKHELLHLVFDPIREEHDFQVASLPQDRRKEYSERILRQIEKAVEHLSHVV